MLQNKNIIAVITAATGDRVVITQTELKNHAQKHFPNLPLYILIEFIEKILKEPDHILLDPETNKHLLFYRIDEKKYVVVVIKRTDDGVYFSSIYPTGQDMRSKHKKFKKVKI